MTDSKPRDHLTQRKRRHAPGRIVAVYTCYRCRVTWQAEYPAPWALVDPMYKRDTCPACQAGAAILSGYTSCLPLDAPPVQLELEL
jgi:hypothetical protein